MWNLNAVHEVFTAANKTRNVECDSHSVHCGQKDVQHAARRTRSVHHGRSGAQYAVRGSRNRHCGESCAGHGQ